MTIKHDSFFRSLFARTEICIEFLEYLKNNNNKLSPILKYVDLTTLKRIPSDFSNTDEFGYADLAYTAQTNIGTNILIGILIEHKSFKDNYVLQQLYNYHYHLMKKIIKGKSKNLPTVALIFYNGAEKWNPVEEIYNGIPDELQPIMLPFQSIFMDVSKIPEEICATFNPVLALGLFALKYIWDFEKFRKYFKKYEVLLKNKLSSEERLDFIHEIDVYFKHKVSTEYKEAFTMDFVKLPYKTIWDSEIEEAKVC